MTTDATDWPLKKRVITGLVMIVMPLWGLGVNCSGDEFQILAVPDVFAFYGLYSLTVIAYVASRLKPGPLPERWETVVFAGLIIGAILTAMLAIHMGPALVLMLLLLIPAPFVLMFLPLVAPLLVLVMQLREVRRRMHRRNSEGSGGVVGQGVLVALLGLILYGAILATVKARPDAALDVFTRAHEGVLARWYRGEPWGGSSSDL